MQFSMSADRSTHVESVTKQNQLQPLDHWGQDPNYSSFRKLAISTIRNMVIKVESADIFLFYLCGRGISKVEIVGIVRSVQTRQKKVVYHIDDGTGSMRCVKFFNTSDATSYSAFLPGDMVAVKGILVMSETNEEDYGFCIHLSCMEIVDDPNMETFHWLSCIDLFQSEYSHGTS